ncbi:hypothetical protein GOODEAATRI_025928 [Goodea atripinnis]|uniref:Uncharacterized protein n=1 Tax=Goodea atripinnis TaxID=208336 RepID=A0ABV0NN84_9TELE
MPNCFSVSFLSIKLQIKNGFISLHQTKKCPNIHVSPRRPGRSGTIVSLNMLVRGAFKTREANSCMFTVVTYRSRGAASECVPTHINPLVHHICMSRNHIQVEDKRMKVVFYLKL